MYSPGVHLHALCGKGHPNKGAVTHKSSRCFAADISAKPKRRAQYLAMSWDAAVDSHKFNNSSLLLDGGKPLILALPLACGLSKDAGGRCSEASACLVRHWPSTFASAIV